MRDIDRRTFLSAAAAAAAVGTTGLAAGTSDEGSIEAKSQFHFDAANTGYAPDREGPKRFLHQTQRFDQQLERGLLGHPAVTDDGLYFATVSEDDSPGTLWAIDRETGATRWTADLNPLPILTPAANSETVFVADSHYFVAYDAESGEEKWATLHDSGIDSSPVVTDGTMYATGRSGVYVLDAETGETEDVWQEGPTLATSPAVGEDNVFVGGTVDGISPNHLVAYDRETGGTAWQTEVPAAWTPTVADGYVYTGDYGVYALDTETGAVEWSVGWAEDGSWDGAEYSVAVGHGTLYHTSGGNLYAFDSAAGLEDWSFEDDAVDLISAPVVADGTVYVGDDIGGLMTFDADSGEVLGQFPPAATEGAATTPPAILDGTAYYGTYAPDGGSDTGFYAVEDGRKARAPARPIANFEQAPYTATVGERVQFVVHAEPNGNRVERYSDEIAEIQWDFDDGRKTTGDHIQRHTFDSAGEYEVSVTVVDRYGLTTTDTTKVTVGEDGNGGQDDGNDDSDGC